MAISEEQEQDLNENIEEIAGAIEMPKERRSYSLHKLMIWGSIHIFPKEIGTSHHHFQTFDTRSATELTIHCIIVLLLD